MFKIGRVESPQSVEVVVAGPGPANRLVVFTGIAIVDLEAVSDNTLFTDHALLDVSSFHGDKLFDPAATQVVAAAWPSSMHATDDADDVTWAVDSVDSSIGPDGKLLLDVALALQGSHGLLSRFAYEVFARATSLTLARVLAEPKLIVLSQGPVAFTVVVQLTQAAIGSGEPVSLSIDPIDHPGVSLPRRVTVPPGTDVTTAIGTVDPVGFPLGDTQLTITAETIVSKLFTTITVHK